MSTPYLHPRRLDLTAGLLLWAGLVAGFLIFAPGLSALFTFDDFPNLRGLDYVKGEPNLYSAIQFIADGKSGPLGRPLSMATFAAQYASWPSAPADFLRVNLLLHLLNATLLFWSMIRLLPLLGQSRARALAITGAVAWLWVMAAPHVSTVLYAVQRMAILAGTFQLAGFLMYLAGRQYAVDGREHRGVLLMLAGVSSGLGLGVLAKESAATFPLLLLILEATLLRHVPKSALWRATSVVLVVAPTLLLLGYLVLKIPVWIEGTSGREFTLGERLLTQTRVLFIYLGRILIPSFSGARLLYDDLAASTSLLQPWTTATSIAAWIGLAAAAWRWRRPWPLLAFALLWFIGAQLLESSVVPLELAFEHRSYLAMIGPLLAVADGVRRMIEWQAARRVRPGLVATSLLYLVALSLAAYLSTGLWGRPLQQAYVWVEQQPHSLRARFQLAAVLDMHRRGDEAARVYHEAIKTWPDDPNLLLPLFMRCDPAISVAQVERAIRAAHRDLATTMLTLSHAGESLKEAGCARSRAADLRRLMQTALESPFLSIDRCTALGVRFEADEARGDRAAAREALDEYVRRCPRVGAVQLAVFWSVQDNDLEKAKAYLEIAESSPRISALHRWAYRKEIAGTRQLIAIWEELQKNPLP